MPVGVRLGQTLEERYRGGIVNGVGARVAAAGARVSETEKRLLWELIAEDARRLRDFGFHAPEPRRFAEWVQEVTMAGRG